MTVRHCLLLLLSLAALVAASGCKKEEASAWTGNSVRVALPELQQSLANNLAPEVQKCLQDVSSAMRYGRYELAVAGLERLTTQPSLTAQQRKLTGEVIGQLKELSQKSKPK